MSKTQKSLEKTNFAFRFWSSSKNCIVNTALMIFKRTFFKSMKMIDDTRDNYVTMTFAKRLTHLWPKKRLTQWRKKVRTTMILLTHYYIWNLTLLFWLVFFISFSEKGFSYDYMLKVMKAKNWGCWHVSNVIMKWLMFFYQLQWKGFRMIT
jgi:hypothetical protein